jgi:hypothetical protein
MQVRRAEAATFRAAPSCLVSSVACDGARVRGSGLPCPPGVNEAGDSVFISRSAYLAG